jgi:hypothetical protein
VTKLNGVRDDGTVYNSRLDTVLADVFNLLSFFYLTTGMTKGAPATYSQLASMRVSNAEMKQALVQNRATGNASFHRITHLSRFRLLLMMGFILPIMGYGGNC